MLIENHTLEEESIMGIIEAGDKQKKLGVGEEGESLLFVILFVCLFFGGGGGRMDDGLY